MSLQTITQDLASSLGLVRNYGVIVSDVWPSGPAEAAGLKIGDILVSVDGEAAENLPTVMYNFRLRDAAENVRLVVLRGGAQQALSIKPVEQRNDLDSLASVVDPAKNLIADIGIVGVEIDPRMDTAAAGLRDPFGIIVVARTASANADVPLAPRDIIRELNGKRMLTVENLRSALRDLPAGAPATLQIQRDANLMYVTFIHE